MAKAKQNPIEVETVVKSDEVVEPVKEVVNSINVSKVVKALSVPTISGIEVSILDATNQTRKVNLSGILEKFNDNPDGTNKLGLTNRETLQRAITDLIGFSTPQRVGYTLAGLLGMVVNPTMSLGGFEDVSISDADKIKLIVTDQTVGQRGRSKSNTEVFEL